MRRIILVLTIILLLLAGCTVKEGQLVVLNDSEQDETKSSEKIMYEQYDAISQAIPVDKYAETIKKIGSSLIPLAVSPDCSIVFAYEYTGNSSTDSSNSDVIVGNMLQQISLYAVNIEKKETKPLGKFLSLKDFKFDETGKLFAFIDGNNNVYMYDISNSQLDTLIPEEKYASYNTLSWSRDSKRLMIDTRMEFDISSRQFISKAVDSYTPFIMRKFSANSYIVQMKNNEYSDMLALYDFNKKSFTNLANGIYLDSDNLNILYTKDYMHNLNVVSLKTQESKSLDNGPIYCAYIMKSTGDVLYTTLNPELDSQYRYILVKVNPETTKKETIKLTTPTFYLSYAEDKMYFIGNTVLNNFSVNTSDLTTDSSLVQTEDTDIYGIKTTLLKMFQLDYEANNTYEKYEQEAKKIYTDTYSSVPQEALENKLIDFRRFNMALPSTQKEAFVPPTIQFVSYRIDGSTASVNLGFYYINSIELVKLNNTWYITGFSTYPQSSEVSEIRALVQKHLDDIKAKNKDEALKYWSNSNINVDFNNSQKKIVEDLMANSDKYKMEIGEVELWSMSDPHRAQNAESATEARVKIVISEGSNTIKYKLILTRHQSSPFVIESWNTDPLSISQLF